MQRNKANRFAQKESGTRHFMQIGVAALAVVFITAGIKGQEHLDVMQKAVRICLECIGIG